MNREQAFITRWHAEREFYKAWGQLVSSRTEESLGPIIAPVQPNYFLKTEVKPRLKDDWKLVEKAFYRKKPYLDPYASITDKVGIRFVVLLNREIRVVEQAIAQIPGWSRSKDRDYEEEQIGNPSAFEYAALHLVIRPNNEVEYNGIRIPAGTPCEVQIKTLLQHAYSELTHDTIYKPQIDATPTMRRNAAKAMALLEATNDYFERVQDDVERALSSVRDITVTLSSIYKSAVGFEPKPSSLEGLLLSAYEASMTDYVTGIRDLLREKPFIAEAIRRRVRESNPIFVQPSVLLAYLMIARSTRSAKQLWPLTPQEQEPLLTDLGVSGD
jgi:putative GTP pyrophosphokinase